MRILQICARDFWSGAERIAWLLFKGLQNRGHDSRMAVGVKVGDDPGVMVVPCGERYGIFRKRLWLLQQALLKSGNRIRGTWRLSRLVRAVVEPGSIRDSYRGHEDYRYPGTWRLFELVGGAPDVIHLHSLHGDFFDLRALPWLSARVPTVVTLHDMWMLTGLCTYSLECGRWQPGCTDCPLLRSRPFLIPSFLRKDGTPHNWHQKKEIYEKCRMYVATPSAWLMEKVKRSILAGAVIEDRVIPYGIDLSAFNPGDRAESRNLLGLPPAVPVVLAVAAAILRHPLKGFGLMQEAMARLSSRRRESKVVLVAIGSKAADRNINGLEIRFVPFVKSPRELARYYQAADVYLHGAVQDNFPNTVLEAVACGTPVVATAVGGIPEQVRPALVPGTACSGVSGSHAYCDAGRATGVLVPPGDPEAMARAVEWLLDSGTLRRQMGQNAAADARERFNLGLQLDRYAEWYEEIRLRANLGSRGCD